MVSDQDALGSQVCMFKICHRRCLWPQLGLGVLYEAQYIPELPIFCGSLCSVGRGWVRADPLQAEESVQRRVGHRAPEILPGSLKGVVEALMGLPHAFQAHAACLLKEVAGECWEALRIFLLPKRASMSPLNRQGHPVQCSPYVPAGWVSLGWGVQLTC